MSLLAPIPGFIGYQVSNLGEVISPRGKKLKPWMHDGYPYISLGRGNKYSIATLVLRAFKGERPKGYECCHGDGNRLNSNLENLRWDTRSANRQDAVRHGTHPAPNRGRFGLSSFNSKYNEIDVERVRDLRRNGCTFEQISDWTGISQSQTKNIVHGRQRAFG